jgi:hypothetical protein
MSRRFLYVLLIGGGLAAITSRAQDAPDLLGTWTQETTIPAGDGDRCGDRSISGTLSVTKKITARAYRGTARMMTTLAKCRGGSADESDFTLRVHDDDVSIEYDNEGWAGETLALEGAKLTGKDAQGTAIEWVKQAEQGADAEIDYARFDEYLNKLAPEFRKELRLQFRRNLLINLERTGLSTKEAEQVADQTLDRMTSCVLDMVRDQVAAQHIPLDKLLLDPNAHIYFDPKSIDYRKMDCIYAAAMNAGVVIR